MESIVQHRDVWVTPDKIRRLNRMVNCVSKNVKDYIVMIGEHFLEDNCEKKEYVVPDESMHT
jgi:hypothetical protein